MSTESRMGHDPLAWLSADTPQERMPPTPHADLLGEGGEEPPAEAGEGCFQLGEELVITRAAELYQGLKGRLAGEERVLRLDAAMVERIDGAGLQLLVAFCRAAAEGGKRVEWGGLSDALRDAARLAGLEGHLALD